MKTALKQITLATECCTPAAAPAISAVRFHLSLNVANLEQSVRFYRTLFDVEPAKRFDDYAKFELDDPPLVLSLEPQPHGGGGSLNHLGFRLSTSADLVSIQRRLETAGTPTTREDGVECCYAKQTKFWVDDPDRNHWEMYVLEHDVEHRGETRLPEIASANTTPAASTDVPSKLVTWEHMLGQSFPETIPIADGRADQVLLKGTFNAPLSPAESARILREAFRALRPGGKLLIHGLVADQKLNGAPPSLPGPAAAVRHVPVLAELLAVVEAAAFRGIMLKKLSASAIFRHEGVPLREMMLEAAKCKQTPFDLRQAVIYKGSFQEVNDGAGNVFPRGTPVIVGSATAELLRSGSAATDFVFVLPGESLAKS